MILKKPIGKETGYFGLHAIAEEFAILLEEKEVYLAGYGYPEFEMKDEEEENKNSGFELWKERGRIVEIEEKKGIIHCQISSCPGLRGSGVFYQKDANTFDVIGVHVGRYEASGAEICWISKEKFQQIHKWREEATREKYEAIIHGKCCENGVRELDFYDKLEQTGLDRLIKYPLNDLED